MLTLVRADHAAVAALLFIPLTSASAHRLLVGQSVAGHRMVAFELGDPSSPRKDGYSAGTRQNAHGVDLNGKFPSAWRPLGGIYDSGPRALSKPENRFAYRLIVRVRPRTSIWFDQHERLVDESGGDLRVERRFSRLVGMPLRRLPREPGSAVGWENHRLPGATAFVVELPSGSLSTPAASRFARSVRS